MSVQSEWFCSGCNYKHFGNCPKVKTVITFSAPTDKPDSVDQPTLEQILKQFTSVTGQDSDGNDDQWTLTDWYGLRSAINNHQIRMLQQLREKMTIFPPNGVYDISMFAVTVNDLDELIEDLRGKK
jgi:hypothetical protein